MTTELERRVAKGVLASKSVSGSAGKAMVVGGTSALAVTLLASIIPFLGALPLAIVLIALGLFMWE